MEEFLIKILLVLAGYSYYSFVMATIAIAFYSYIWIISELESRKDGL